MNNIETDLRKMGCEDGSGSEFFLMVNFGTSSVELSDSATRASLNGWLASHLGSLKLKTLCGVLLCIPKMKKLLTLCPVSSRATRKK
jgi:hypothetical protein